MFYVDRFDLEFYDGYVNIQSSFKLESQGSIQRLSTKILLKYVSSPQLRLRARRCKISIAISEKEFTRSSPSTCNRDKSMRS